jgi:hypothetical protein
MSSGIRSEGEDRQKLRDRRLSQNATTSLPAVSVDHIERTTLVLHGHRVMLDEALAALYGVETRALIQAVKRNIERFPADFVFQLTHEEARHSRSQSVILNGQDAAAKESEGLRSQSATSNGGRRGRQYLPLAVANDATSFMAARPA